MGCKIVVIPEYNEHGRNNDKRGIDLKALETNLKFYSSTKQRDQINNIALDASIVALYVNCICSYFICVCVLFEFCSCIV